MARPFQPWSSSHLISLISLNSCLLLIKPKLLLFHISDVPVVSSKSSKSLQPPCDSASLFTTYIQLSKLDDINTVRHLRLTLPVP